MKVISEERLVITPAMMAGRSHRQKVDMPRTPGVHVQAINQRLGIAAGKLSDSDADDFPFEKMTPESYPLMMALGVAWEEFRASCYSEDEMVWQPGELERDDIHGTPDGLLFDDRHGHAAHWECKRTTKKVQPVTDMWMYIKQGLSYCAMSGLTRVMYDLLFVCGDYKRPYQPMGTVTLIEFTTAECDAWWKVVAREAKNTKPEGMH